MRPFRLLLFATSIFAFGCHSGDKKKDAANNGKQPMKVNALILHKEKLENIIDFTARDLQQKAKEKGLPWDIAKGFNGSAPVSDTFIPLSQFKELNNINFKLEVDGVVKQQGNTGHMLFNFDYIISYLSNFFTLKTGDLIFTGTPKGVGPVALGNRLTAYIENEKLLEFEVK